MAERNRRAKITPDTTNLTVTFAPFVAGTDQPSGESFVASLRDLPTDIQNLLALDRLRNKLMDSYSDKSTDVMTQVRDTYAMLENGDWSTRGEGADRTTLFIEAYAAVNNRDVAEIRALVNKLAMSEEPADVAKLKAARSHPKIDAKMKELAATRAAERAAKAAEAAGKAEEAAMPDLEAA